jgi:acetyl esterase/lipase
MKRTFTLLTLIPGFAFAGVTVTTTPLWKDVVPGEIPTVIPGAKPEGRAVNAERITDVAAPTITRFNPEKPDGRALIVCPGGGYHILAIRKEGEAVARRFAKDGLTVVVLHYRVPVKVVDSPEAAPRHDLAETLRQVRADMVKQGFDKPRVGVLGFSAGGHLALESAYGPMPKNAPRPDFVVAVYPAYLTEKSGELKKEFAPTKDSPPACFVHAADDSFPAEADAQLWSRLKKSGVPAELHLYATGGHGFGISDATKGKPVAAWPDVVETWINSLPAAKDTH